ncbi:MAG: outer membrane lipoprotein carrier protein LolA [Spirochaetia bacterium]|jgi:outer membrane lipoprotein-sorting protein|nr:outer membrane lipoprotein carrier protein LolA [Spirochaetia bacterium]
MKKISIILILSLFGVLYAITTSELHDKVKLRYQNLSSFQANVQQTNYYTQLKRSIVYSGKLYFTPGRMLMSFSKPSVQRLQIQSGKAELYDASSNTLLRSNMQPEFGKMNPVEILQHYWTRSKVSIVKQEKHLCTVKLIPQKDPMIKDMQAVIDSKTGIVNSLKYADPAGNTVTYLFSNIKRDAAIPPSVWKYDYPKDVQVISQ